MMLSPAARAITALLIVPGFSRATGQAANSRANISFKTISGNLKRSSWQWDYDQFRVNQIGHPFQDLSLSWYRTFVFTAFINYCYFFIKKFPGTSLHPEAENHKGIFPQGLLQVEREAAPPE